MRAEYDERISSMNIDHQAEINEIEFRLEHQESQHQNELSDLEARLRNEMEDVKAKHQEEIAIMQQGSFPTSLHYLDPVSMSQSDGEGLSSHDLELQNVTLQAELQQLRGLLAEVKLKEKRLEAELISLRGGGGANNMVKAGPVLAEPTEIEYLKKVLYEYMMGRETKTMAKVIAAVVKFSREQTENIIAKEEQKQGLVPEHVCTTVSQRLSRNYDLGGWLPIDDPIHGQEEGLLDLQLPDAAACRGGMAGALPPGGGAGATGGGMVNEGAVVLRRKRSSRRKGGVWRGSAVLSTDITSYYSCREHIMLIEEMRRYSQVSDSGNVEEEAFRLHSNDFM
ncbi:golgin subfamily A member 4-like [Lytechinus variegatus]|uniref:golgin subfamily A member 4-like n=1 Tax=Lytechinus variegatus TaxID=7654 RepID=UPI001BB1B716|nr:golgin subfamily A member 4-like [Lytechinus variegatus]